MKRGQIILALIALHTIFWLVFLRHLPFFRFPISFLDFDSYMRLWSDVFAGINPYLSKQLFTLGPPLVLLPYLPFALLPLNISQFLFFIANVYCGYSLTQIFTTKYFKGSLIIWLGLSLVLFATFPVRFSLLMGQPSLIVAYALTLVLVSKQNLVSMFFLVLTKTYFAGVLLALSKKKMRIIQVVFALIATIFAFSPLLLPKWYVYYVKNTLVSSVVKSPGSDGNDYYNQSLKSTLHRFSLDGIYLPSLLILGVVLSYFILKSGSVVLASMVSIYLSPVVWQHYMVFLFPIIVITAMREKSQKIRALLFCSFLLVMVEIPRIHSLPVNFLTSLVASHMFWGMSLLLLVVLWQVWLKETRPQRILLEGSLS